MRGAFTPEEARRLRAATDGMWAYGEPTWAPLNGAWRGRLSCSTTLIERELALEVEFRPSPLRASEPTVVLLCGGSWVARVDVNGSHTWPDGVRRETSHYHWRDDEDDPKGDAVLFEGGFPYVPHVPGALRDGCLWQVVVDSCRVLGVDYAGISWIDPPEGVYV